MGQQSVPRATVSWFPTIAGVPQGKSLRSPLRRHKGKDKLAGRKTGRHAGSCNAEGCNLSRGGATRGTNQGAFRRAKGEG